jgi:hypothetical protein
MSGDHYDELLREAEQIFREREENDPNAELGDDMTPDPEGHFRGRWRGTGLMTTKGGSERGVFLVWNIDGEPGFLYQHTALVHEVDEIQPQIGDEVLVFRGPTREFTTKDGDERQVFPYVLRKRECSDPLPDASTERPDDEIPF